MMNPLTNVKNIAKLSERELTLGISGKSSWHNMYKDSAWIFIGGLPYDITEGDVLSVFSQYGEIANLNLVRDKKTGKSKGFCFLCYIDQRSTILAVDNFNGIKLCGRTIRVDHVADYKPPKEDENEDEITKTLRIEGCAPKPLKRPLLEEIVSVKNKKVKKEKKKKKERHRSSSSNSSISCNEEVTNKKKIKIKKEKVNMDYDKYEFPDKCVQHVSNRDKAEFDSESGTYSGDNQAKSPTCRSSFKNYHSNKETTRIRDSYEVHSSKTSKSSAKESYYTRNNTDSHKYSQNVSYRRERNEKSSQNANDSSKVCSSQHHGKGEGSSHKEYDRMDYRKSESHSSSRHYRKTNYGKHSTHRENF